MLEEKITFIMHNANIIIREKIDKARLVKYGFIFGATNLIN